MWGSVSLISSSFLELVPCDLETQAVPLRHSDNIATTLSYGSAAKLGSCENFLCLVADCVS